MLSTLKIEVEEREGQSFLRDAYVTQPFRITPVGQYKSDRAAYLMIASTSPGILSGDTYDIQVNIKENARLQLQSQSYQRLFNMEGSASQMMDVKIDKGASFSYVPHPVVPHEASTFKSINRVSIDDDCELTFSEIITCGRKHHGEEFKYAHFQNLLEVYHHDRLILKDNVLLRPDIMPLSAMGLLEGFTHQGTLVYLNTKNEDVEDHIEHFYKELEELENVSFGISALEAKGFVIRILGNGGEQMFDFFRKVQSVLWEEKIAIQI
ncbi:urease accessory protein UreD [Flavobacterium granuli]|uniref:Urease accessory protein UreD n=1 Tax=Flavobacterium granuli TaxID=280093 RepID=A0A1M5RZN1_9FLAO|nr:urease accessory protein UreD [Flavobacterium granuli]PRZ21157.1 urease accessory protein [Flavobacterium granuli]SHH31624.1 urease accessory protein [Flavobacterium granuli]